MAMMRIDCVNHITNTATATSLLPCLYNGTVLRRRSLSLLNGGFLGRNYQLRCVSASSDSLQFDFSPPPIDHNLLDTISVAGGKFSEDGIVESFDNDDEALDAFDNGVVVVDLSHFGRIRATFFAIKLVELTALISFTTKLLQILKALTKGF